MIAVTGASGFIGRAVVSRLRSEGERARAVTRRDSDASMESIAVGDLDGTTDWAPALDGVDCVIHAAGRAHVLREEGDDPLAEFRRVNVEATRALVEAAVRCGVRRIVFLSSIGVLGNATAPGCPFDERSPIAPVEPYAVSKAEAEEVLEGTAGGAGIETVIVRPPLVYGPGAPGNFARLVRLVRLGVPLPLARVENARSLVALDNLVDLLLRCIDHPAAVGRRLLVSDGEDLSTPELVRQLASAMRRPAVLVPVPTPLLRAVGFLSGRSAEIGRLLGDLQIDPRSTFEALAWSPPWTVRAALAQAVRDRV
ncbi:MAG: NAD-dependent epimerase/dehydratase family protein [Pseudomonadales bacterium]|nr:NAD-dependent epimerase/dehydratase family protein [Pseudomonadales bacterium]